MESVLSLQSITSVEVGHKATPPDKSKIGIMFRLIVFPPAHACRLIPKDVELVNRAEFAKEFTKFLLEERYIEKGRGGLARRWEQINVETAAENLVHRSGNLTDKHLDGVWVRTTVIRPVPHPLPVPHPVHHNYHFAPFLQNSGSPVTLCYSV